MIRIDPYVWVTFAIAIAFSLVVLLPIIAFYKVIVIWGVSILSYIIFRRFGTPRDVYINRLLKILNSREKIIYKQEEIISETKQNYQIVHDELLSLLGRKKQ